LSTEFYFNFHFFYFLSCPEVGFARRKLCPLRSHAFNALSLISLDIVNWTAPSESSIIAKDKDFP